MPHSAAESLWDGVSVRKRISGVWELSRVIMSVLEGLCLPVFCVFWVMRVSSGIASAWSAGGVVPDCGGWAMICCVCCVMSTAGVM